MDPSLIRSSSYDDGSRHCAARYKRVKLTPKDAGQTAQCRLYKDSWRELATSNFCTEGGRTCDWGRGLLAGSLSARRYSAGSFRERGQSVGNSKSRHVLVIQAKCRILCEHSPLSE